ncbi:unnamed protein product [Haemonchus placei]|uniref:Uncharacterized protein n=1 Tax=Haemonchus placei TaxID=6290 RepID=A0A3P7WFI7_HAEPC|nr:unnamed protein product [Haemonchus placei]
MGIMCNIKVSIALAILGISAGIMAGLCFAIQYHNWSATTMAFTSAVAASILLYVHVAYKKGWMLEWPHARFDCFTCVGEHRISEQVNHLSDAYILTCDRKYEEKLKEWRFSKNWQRSNAIQRSYIFVIGRVGLREQFQMSNFLEMAFPSDANSITGWVFFVIGIVGMVACFLSAGIKHQTLTEEGEDSNKY